MFRDQTVFVLGAGASAEVDMPDGRALANSISRALYFRFQAYQRTEVFDHQMHGHLERLAAINQQPIGLYQQAAREIQGGIELAGSVDEYLYRHADRALVAPVGKLAILHCIAKAEQNSKLYVGNDARSRSILEGGRNTWLRDFSEQLCFGRPATDIGKIFDGIAIISFNYDRCLQRYLMAFIEQAYHTSSGVAEEAVSTLRVLYPYGTIGSLTTRGASYLPFGVSSDAVDLSCRIDAIRTFTEQVADHSTIDDIKATIQGADRLVFLGFGFHKPNLDMLDPGEPMRNRRSRDILATAFGLSLANANAVQQQLVERFTRLETKFATVERELKAQQLLQDYRLRLMV